jgi:hypothetical protein
VRWPTAARGEKGRGSATALGEVAAAAAGSLGGREREKITVALVPCRSEENTNPRIGWGCILIAIWSWAWPITEGQESKCTQTLIQFQQK